MIRTLKHSLVRYHRFSSLANHTIVPMPALSPTMMSGTIGKWLCKYGDKISPGDSIAEIETDKASMAFEAQDEFYVAKILVMEGVEVPVGSPILITTESKVEESAFANFILPAAPSAANAVIPTTVKVATPAPPSQPSPTPQPSPASILIEKSISTPALPKKIDVPIAKNAVPSSVNLSMDWRQNVFHSPLGKKLRSQQMLYIKKYGRSAQKPV